MQTHENMEVANGVVTQDSSHESSDDSNLIQEIEAMRNRGEVRSEEFVSKMKRLEILLGVSQISPFGTNEIEIFEEKIREMSLSEMQSLARKVGVNPLYNRTLLKTSLLKEFRYNTRNSSRNIMPSAISSFVPDSSNPEHDKLIKLLNDV